MPNPMRLLLAGLLFAATAANAADWEVGKNYFPIEPAQATASGDRVEVLEVFSYACSHCASFQPYAEKLKAALPKQARFDYMPAVFNAQWEPYARAYYAAQSLGVLDKTHQALFDTLHRDHKPLRSIQDLAGFYSGYGVEPARFIAAANSFEVESKLQRAKDLVRNAGVDGTPTVLVNGKFRATAASAGGPSQLVELVEYLVKKEAAGAKPSKGAKG